VEVRRWGIFSEKKYAFAENDAGKGAFFIPWNVPV
jgi:hypothetical protein